MMHGQKNIKLHSTCFGHFLLSSSGVLRTVVAATGVCHDTHQWLLLQFLVLLMMGAESFRNM